MPRSPLHVLQRGVGCQLRIAFCATCEGCPAECGHSECESQSVQRSAVGQLTERTPPEKLTCCAFRLSVPPAVLWAHACKVPCVFAPSCSTVGCTWLPVLLPILLSDSSVPASFLPAMLLVVRFLRSARKAFRFLPLAGRFGASTAGSLCEDSRRRSAVLLGIDAFWPRCSVPLCSLTCCSGRLHISSPPNILTSEFDLQCRVAHVVAHDVRCEGIRLCEQEFPFWWFLPLVRSLPSRVLLVFLRVCSPRHFLCFVGTRRLLLNEVWDLGTRQLLIDETLGFLTRQIPIFPF